MGLIPRSFCNSQSFSDVGLCCCVIQLLKQTQTFSIFICILAAMLQGIDEQLSAMVKSADAGNIVRVSRNVIQLLKDNSMAMVMKIHPNFIGVHSLNRDGYGVNPIDVAALLTDIADCGWCDEEVHAVCVDATDHCREFNMKLVASSSGRLPPFNNPDVIKYVSLSASHTNQALRCVLAELPHMDTRLCLDGKLNLAKISMFDSGMAQACSNGLSWLVLPSKIINKHDGLASLIQSGFNAAGQIARPENELQVLRRLHSCWLQESQRVAALGGAKVDFASIKQKVMRSKPPCAAGIPHMYAFMLRASGGQSGEFLQDTEKFVKSTCAAGKSVGGEIYDCLSKDLKGSSSQHILLRHALLKMAYVDSLSAHEAKKFCSKDRERDLGIAEALLVEVRGLCRKYEDSMDVFLARCRFEVDVAAKTVGRNKPSLPCLAHQLIMELRELTQDAVHSRFEAECAQEYMELQKAASSSKPSSGVEQSLGVACLRCICCLVDGVACFKNTLHSDRRRVTTHVFILGRLFLILRVVSQCCDFWFSFSTRDDWFCIHAG